MVKKSWFSNLWKSTQKKSNSNSSSASEKLVIGVLTFEIASLMSKVVHLWNCLKEEQVVRMRDEIMNSIGVRKLVSDDDDYLVGLVATEMMDNLAFVVRSVSMLGKKCTDPVLQRLDIVFDDLIKNYADLFGWEFGMKKMERKVKKMEKFIGTSGGLYQEMEVLIDLEQVLRRMNGSGDPNSATRIEIHKKVVWQRQEVKHLREISLWNRTYDYVVRLLARSIFTIFRRIKDVFGEHQEDTRGGAINHLGPMRTDSLPRSRSNSALMQSSVHPSENNLTRFSSGPIGRPAAKSGPLGRPTSQSGPLGRPVTQSGPINQMSYKQWQNHDRSSSLHGKPLRSNNKKLTSTGPFKGCMMGGSGSPVLHAYSPVISGYPKSYGFYSGILHGKKDAYTETVVHNNILRNNLVRLSSKCMLLTAPPSTLGGAALALHYANVIVVIEKLVQSPHLIGPDARDDLYSMLPKNVRASLRERLRSYVKTKSSFYDTDLATEWSEALSRILEWLAPLAHNMIRWQSERNFQQQHLISKTNVLLVQTLYFANQAKTEAAITELLVGLNYLWRFGRELNEKALLECATSGEFDDYMD